MKKRIFVFIAAVILVLPLFMLNGFSDESQFNIYTEISDAVNGRITVEIGFLEVKKLTGADFRVSYNDSVFSLVGIYPSQTDDGRGNTVDEFPGLWACGELKNGGGCAAAFTSFDGVTKNEKTEFCRIVLKITDGYKGDNDIEVAAIELNSDDGNRRNDIYSYLSLNTKNVKTDDAERFVLSRSGEEVTVEKYLFDESYVRIPSSDGGIAVTDGAFDGFGGFVFADHSVSFDPGAVPDTVTLICYENSVSDNDEAAVNRVVLDDGCEFDFIDRLLYAEAPPETAISLFGGAESVLSEPFVTDGEAEISFNGKKLDVTFSLLGDLDCDGVCDVLDVFEFSRSDPDSFSKAQYMAADANRDGQTNPDDEEPFVHHALGER